MIDFLAQLTDSNPLLYAYGPLGIMCAWFMWRAEQLGREIKMLAHRIDGLTRALLVDMANREAVGDATKRYATEAIARIDARSMLESEDRRH